MTGLRDRPDFTSALAGLETLRQRMTAQHEAARRALRGTMGDMAWAEHFQRQGQALVEAIAPALEALRPMLEFFAEIERGAAAFEATGLLPHPTMPRDLVNRGAEAKRDGWSAKDLATADWPWPEWTDDRLQEAIAAAISIKNGKLTGAVAAYDELYLAVATDEPDIDVDKAARVVAGLEASTSNIDRAFLLLGYNPGVDKGTYPDGCPVLELALR